MTWNLTILVGKLGLDVLQWFIAPKYLRYVIKFLIYPLKVLIKGKLWFQIFEKEVYTLEMSSSIGDRESVIELTMADQRKQIDGMRVVESTLSKPWDFHTSFEKLSPHKYTCF